jgi:hypothetical protein
MLKKWFDDIDVATIMSAFVNRLGTVAPNRFPVRELVKVVITVNCILKRRGCFHCPPSVPIIVVNDYGLVITADPPSSRSLDPVPVVLRWFNGIGCNYGIPHLMISAATEL